MRDLFRLIAVGTMSFAVVGAAMLYSRGEDVPAAVSSFSGTVSEAVAGLASSLAGGDASDALKPETFTNYIPRPRATSWVGLAGFPDQAEIAFPIPRDGGFLSGALHLNFDTQLGEHGDGLLTLAVNGTPRGQLVLDSGRHTHQAQIELTPADLSSSQLVLQMAARGTTTSGQICPTDAANSGSAVTLSPDSRMELVSASAPADPISALLAAPGPLVLQPGRGVNDLALAVWANQRLARAGHNSRLGAAGPGETPVMVSDHAVIAVGATDTNVLVGQDAVTRLIAETRQSPALPLEAPVSVADLGAETAVRSFRGSRRWTIGFAAADMPRGALPEIFSLKLRTTPLTSGSEWVVRVSLNGNLVEAYRVAGTSTRLDYQIALPAERMLPSNVLSVELVDTTPSVGICGRPPEAQAQLLPESSLLEAGAATTAWASLIETLAAAPTISFQAAGLDLAQASAAGTLLGMILPQAATMQFTGEAPVRITAIARDRVLPALMGNPDLQVILPVSTNGGPSIVVLPAGPDLDAALERLDSDDVTLLVTAR
jgi:hypothetical protein